MSYGYGGQSNPYDQRAGNQPYTGYDAPHNQPYGGAAPAYGSNHDYNQPYDYQGQNVEMEPLTGHRQDDPNAILNECREIDKGIDSIEHNLESLKMLQQRSLDDPDSSQQSSTNRQLDALSSETMTMYRNFAGRIKAIKQQRESGSPKNAPQVGKVDRKLKAAINQYQNVESDFRRKLQAQMARQYRIVRPEASEQEVREAVEDTSNQQVFSQALLQSDRRGQSRQALSAVQNRHEAIQKIEAQMIELAQLFQDMETLVVQQEAAVENIEAKGEETQVHLASGVEQVGVAIKSARSARKYKWYCLGVVVLIIIVIVIAVVITQVVNKQVNNPSHKRDITYRLQGAPIVLTEVPVIGDADKADAEVADVQIPELVAVDGIVWEEVDFDVKIEDDLTKMPGLELA